VKNTVQQDIEEYRTLIRSRESDQKKEQEPRSLHVYIPGIAATTEGMQDVYRQLENDIRTRYPNAEFDGRNSMASEDLMKKPEHDRHVKLGLKIAAALREGRDVHLYAHSLGTIETAKVLEHVLAAHPAMKRGEHTDKLHITLISPAGFGKNMAKTVESLARMPRVMTMKTELSGHIFGLETLQYLPLKKPFAAPKEPSFVGIKEQSDLITKTFPVFSQLEEYGGKENTSEISTAYSDLNEATLQARFNTLSPEEQVELRAIDDEVNHFLEKGDKNAVQHHLMRRGKLLSAYIGKAYGGDALVQLNNQENLSDEEMKKKEEEALDKVPWHTFAQALLGVGGIFSGLLAGQPYHKLKEWQQRGVDIKFLVPEFDVLVKLSEIAEFLGGDDKLKTKAVVMPGTHSSSTINPQSITDALRMMSNGK
jgi:hypothetical protein